MEIKMRSLILALNSGGLPHSWISWQEAVTLKCKGLISWEFGDEDFMFQGGVSRLTGVRSKVEVASIVSLKSNFYYKSRVPALTNRNLFRRDLSMCAYCGRTFREIQLTKDHIHPVSKGGETTWTNCVTACQPCNGKKDSKSLKEAGMELLYVPYVPDNAEALILQNKNILADQMKFLQEFLPKHSRVRQKVS
jgi:5-methylcytosine-specific restriction endonuclease McrA